MSNIEQCKINKLNVFALNIDLPVDGTGKYVRDISLIYICN